MPGALCRPLYPERVISDASSALAYTSGLCVRCPCRTVVRIADVSVEDGNGKTVTVSRVPHDTN
jgi:hypothetical protein